MLKSNIFPITVALLCAVAFAEKHRTERAGGIPSQDPIAHQCITVSDIRYYRGDAWYPEPGLGATVTSQCPALAHVRITIAYLDKHGAQLGVGTEFTDLAPGARWNSRHKAWSALKGEKHLHSGSITDVQVDQAKGDKSAAR
jgi:hypothetical protein